MKVLGIETSCDETAVAIVQCFKNGKVNKINEVLVSQVDKHKEFGGVVPELSAREHIKYLDKICKKVLKKSKISLSEMDAICATSGPGLLGGLLIGSNYAKAVALSIKKPFFAINHLQAHILVSRLNSNINFPFLTLLISGGHTQILVAEAYNKFKLLGETLDDAIGEAFDKTAKLMGYKYPGGPEIEKSAKLKKNKGLFKLPRPLYKADNFNFSFSGLKTAVRKKLEGKLSNSEKNNLSYDFQTAVLDCLTDRCEKAMDYFKRKYGNGFFVMSGGVASNIFLRDGLEKLAQKKNMFFEVPPLKLCIDNATMIAWAGIERLKQKESGDSFCFLPKPRWPLEELNNE